LPRKLVIFLLTWVSLVQGRIPSSLEPDYAEAILAYQLRNYSDALKFLELGLQVDPNQLEFLELKALSLVATGSDSKAAEIYAKLLELAKEKKEAEKAPYYFELALIHFRQKQPNEAKDSFGKALASNFNTAASNFFLGVMEFQEKAWENAESRFQAVIAGGMPSLKPVSHIYLGQIAKERQDSRSMVHHFSLARELGMNQMNNRDGSPDAQKMGKEIVVSAEGALHSLSRSSFFGHLSLVSAYDSNVFSSPALDVLPTTGSGQGSAVQTIQWQLGYATAPMKPVQVLPSYRGSFNYNFNQDTKTGQFLAHHLSVYLNVRPLAAFSYGLKTEGIFILQYGNDASGAGKFAPYSLVGSLGPYLRIRVGPYWTSEVHAYFQPQKYYVDSGVAPALFRTGWAQSARVSIKRDLRRSFWNVGSALSANYQRTDGEEFRSKGGTLELNDTIYFSKDVYSTLTGGFSLVDYASRPNGGRTDKILSARLSTVFVIHRDFRLLSDLLYIHQNSNIDGYTYSRYIASLGLTYLF